jgi:acetyl esterase/lipase
MKTRYKVIIVIVAVLAVLAIANANVIRVLWGNWFSAKETLMTGEWEGGTSYMNVPYSDTSESNYLHLFVPESDEPVPLFIMVHGGGFFYNDLDSRQAALFYQKVRDKGYAVATINYRLGQEAGYPAAIEDVKASVRFLRANAAKYGLDPDNFAIAGESAGGYLASVVAATNDDEFNDEKFIGEDELDEEVSAQVQGLVDFYGCLEFWTFDEQYKEIGIPKLIRWLADGWLNDITKGTDANSVEEVWIGKNAEDMTEEERETYGVPYYARENWNTNTDLKVVILHGDADITVPYLQSENFAKLSEELLGENRVSYRLMHNYGHAADGFYSDETIDWILEEVDFGGDTL